MSLRGIPVATNRTTIQPVTNITTIEAVTTTTAQPVTNSTTLEPASTVAGIPLIEENDD